MCSHYLKFRGSTQQSPSTYTMAPVVMGRLALLPNMGTNSQVKVEIISSAHSKTEFTSKI